MSLRFNSADVEAIVSAAKIAPKQTPYKTTMASKLSEIADAYIQSWRSQQRPSPSKILKRLNAINSAANLLLAKLPRSDDQTEIEVRVRLTAQAAPKASTVAQSNPASGHERLRAAIDAVKDIAAWSNSAKHREATKKGRKVGHQGNRAMQILIGNLNGLWLDFWECFPGASSKADKIDGPYIRFVMAFLKRLAAKFSDEDFRHNPGLRNSLKASASAIRERLQRTGIAQIYSGKSNHRKSRSAP